MFLMLLRTGMRIGELLDMKISEVNLEEKKVILYEAQKTRVGRVVYFSDDAKEALVPGSRQETPKRSLSSTGREEIAWVIQGLS